MFNRRVECAAGFAALAAGLAAIAALSITPRAANATSTYASQTGLACGRCHVNPGGGGPNTSFGKAFAANGHKLPQKTARKTAASPDAPGADAAPAQGPDCGYYSSVCNPQFGRVPEIDYSSGLSFMIFPHRD
ncbi:MAG TPA: hypothetical protein VN655_16720 [Pseudolabrys sp.]|jgi:hypothetical protein|nr:hypothetical protein [Pseudolabrys sp.]